MTRDKALSQYQRRILEYLSWGPKTEPGIQTWIGGRYRRTLEILRNRGLIYWTSARGGSWMITGTGQYELRMLTRAQEQTGSADQTSQ